MFDALLRRSRDILCSSDYGFDDASLGRQRRIIRLAPRVRGTPCRRIATCARDRFIPARAGNAPRTGRRRQAYPVHPRACGERPQDWSPPSSVSGSSPRVRGTPPGLVAAVKRIRFIPARAGNAPRTGRRRQAYPVHPRACGERPQDWSPPSSVSGSSPRVRETLLTSWNSLAVGRFIPARAGNAVLAGIFISVHRFHLHQGSSLRRRRKRGALAHGIGRTKGGRNTKLHAVCDAKGRPLILLLTPGNVHDCKVAQRCIEAMPPAAELAADKGYDSVSVGSSPRVRGMHMRRH